MRRIILSAATAAAVLAAGCERQDRNSGVTADEADALNETENMLDAPPDEAGQTGQLPVSGTEATERR